MILLQRSVVNLVGLPPVFCVVCWGCGGLCMLFCFLVVGCWLGFCLLGGVCGVLLWVGVLWGPVFGFCWVGVVFVFWLGVLIVGV